MNRGNMKKWFILVALVFIMVAVGEFWGIRAASAASPPKPIKLRMMEPSEPTQIEQLSPIHGTGTMGVVGFLNNVREPLVDVGKKGEPVPKLATRWEHSQDFTKWRFYLRRGVKFHNGDNFTARDVVELVKWAFEEKKVSTLYLFVPIQKAVAVDDYTVDLFFEKPEPLLLITLNVMKIAPTAITRDNRELYKTVLTGTGPYRFVEWKRGQYIKLAKFEDYWGPKPQIDDVEIIFRAEEGVRLAALMAGEVEWVRTLSPEQAKLAPKVAHIPSVETVVLLIDEYIQKEQGGVSVLADKRLRLAVDYAIDRQALVALYKGFATVSLGQLASPGDFGFNPGLKSRPSDLEKAKALVREAGAVGRTVTLVGASDRWAKGKEVAEAVAYMIEQTGLKVKLMLMPHNEAKKYKEATGNNRKLKADMMISPEDTPLETETRFSHMLVNGGKNSAINDLETARLYNEALAESDLAKREQKLAKAYAYVYEQAHCVPLFKPELIWGLAKNLEWNVDIVGRPFIADMRFTN